MKRTNCNRTSDPDGRGSICSKTGNQSTTSSCDPSYEQGFTLNGVAAGMSSDICCPAR